MRLCEDGQVSWSRTRLALACGAKQPAPERPCTALQAATEAHCRQPPVLVANECADTIRCRDMPALWRVVALCPVHFSSVEFLKTTKSNSLRIPFIPAKA